MTLRIGILGAARIAPMALIAPARSVDEVAVACVAARERPRAEACARKHRHTPHTPHTYIHTYPHNTHTHTQRKAHTHTIHT